MWRTAERLFYYCSYAVTILVLAAFCLQYKNFNSPEYFLETNYLHWTSTLPAVSFCQAFPPNSSDKLAEKFLKNLLRPEDVYCRGCDAPKDEFPVENYSSILLKNTASCDELFSKCFWNGDTFDCCQRVGEVFTNKGKCYTFNSYSIRNDMKFSVSHFARESVLDVVVTAPTQVFIHDPKAVKFISKTAPIAIPGTRLDMLYSSREVKVDQSAWDLTIKQRGCILQGEMPLMNSQVYSETACKLECLIRNQMRYCNCTHHLLPNYENRPTCNKTGLLCLDEKFRDLEKPKIKRKKAKCKCLPACEEIDVKIIRASLDNTDSQDIIVSIQQSTPPTERLILRARVEFVDIIVGIACFSRLFTSTSFLGIVNDQLLRPDRRLLQYYFYRQLLY